MYVGHLTLMSETDIEQVGDRVGREQRLVCLDMSALTVMRGIRNASLGVPL
jgi:hypothetical protein